MTGTHVGSFVRPLVLVVMFVALGLCVAPALAQDAVTLKFKWAKGDVIRQRMTIEGKSKVSNEHASKVPGENASMEMNETRVYVLRTTVKEVSADGAATLTAVIESFKFDLNAVPYGTLLIDSADPEIGKYSDNPKAAMLRCSFAMVNQEFTMVVEPTGAVREIRELDKLVDKAAATSPSPRTGLFLKDLFNEKDMKQMFVSRHSPLPANPVRPGDSWDSTVDMSMPFFVGGASAEIHSVYKGVEKLDQKDFAKIDHAIVITATPPKDKGTLLFDPVKDGGSHAEIWFDAEKGRVRRTLVRINTLFDSIARQGKGPRTHIVKSHTTTIEDLGTETTK